MSTQNHRPIPYLLTMLLAAFALLVGFATAQEIQRGGTLVQAYAFSFDSLDPQLSNLRGAPTYAIFDTLLGYELIEGTNDEFAIVPALATSFEAIEPTVIEFTLREGVTFHDGSAWNAEVAKWNLERARDDEQSAVVGTLANLEEVEIVDDYTIRMHLSEPQPVLPLQLTPVNNISVYMVSMNAVESMGDEAFARQPIGTGPFKVVRWIPDDRLELEAFDGYWKQGADGEPLPYVDAYVIRQITDQAVSRLELLTRNIDAYFDPLPQDVALIENNPDAHVQRVPLVFRGRPSFYFNPRPETDSPFSQDVRLRQAAQHATNRDAMAAALGFGTADPHYYWGWYPGVPGYDDTLPRYDYDIERARELLAEAGYPDGVEVDVKVINRASDVQPLEVLQAMWAEAGIQLNIVLLDRLPWIDDGRSGNFEALAHGNTAQPSPLLRQETRTGSNFNWAGYSSPAVDALWEQVETEYDPARRAEIYREIQRNVYEDAFHLIGYRIPQLVAVSNDVQGLTTIFSLPNVWLDR